MSPQKNRLSLTIFILLITLMGFASDLFAQSSLQPRIDEGNVAFETGRISGKKSDFLRALAIFQEIRNEKETPYSIQLELTAKIVAAYQALGQDIEAVNEFLLICQTNYSAQFINNVPLFWSSKEASSINARLKTQESSFSPWLNSFDNPSKKWNPVAQLLAASILLQSPQYHQQSAQILQKLAVLESPDLNNSKMVEFCHKISLLASAQLWRLKLNQPTIKESDVDFWQKTIQRFPASLKYGPYFLVSEGYRKVKNNEKSLDASLRLAILFPEKRTLVAQVLENIVPELEERGQNREANILKMKLIQYNAEISNDILLQ